MFRKIVRELGMCLIANAALFTPIIASADDGSGTGIVLGFPIGAIATGAVLVSMSHTKSKATEAKEYVKGDLKIHESYNQYLRTDIEKDRINDD